jgi:glycosyltransferase involved in cell wall biosynthesis
MAERCSGHRVALVHWAVPPTTGGVESHVSDLASALAARGSEVVVLTGEPKPAPIRGAELVTSPLLDLSTIRSKGLAGPLYLRRLEQFLRHVIEDHDIDVVHGHNLHHFTPEPALAIDGLRQRLNLRVHHTFHETWPDVLHERPVYQHWDGTYATSRFVQDECSMHIGFRPELLPLGVDTGRFEARRPPLAGSGPPMILHPARLLPWKGVHVSVEMLHELRRRHGREARLVVTDTQRIVDWNLELVDYRRRIRDRVSELGLVDWVEYRSVDYADMPALFGSADVVVYPTLAGEPFGLVPLEAMSCERPVVVSRCGGLCETIVDGLTGFSVSPSDAAALADAVARLFRDPAQARQMGRAGRERVCRSFSLDRYVDDLIARYDTAADRPAGC